MGRIIAIDYGKKRTGFAVSDPLQLIAAPLITVFNGEELVYLREYLKWNDVELFLLGEPRQTNYRPSENMARVKKFKRNLEESIPWIKVRLEDERFTSILARRAMIEGGFKKKRDKTLIDRLSAVILLQTYLESIRK